MRGIDVMRQHIGQQQDRDNDALTTWFKAESHHGDLDIDPANVSWCACSVNAAERESGRPGTGLLNAQSFRTYGMKVDIDNAQEGDILVFHFPFDSDWQGHVTYFVSRDDDSNTFRCLGGNQNHMVKESDYVQDYVTDVRRS